MEGLQEKEDLEGRVKIKVLELICYKKSLMSHLSKDSQEENAAGWCPFNGGTMLGFKCFYCNEQNQFFIWVNLVICL